MKLSTMSKDELIEIADEFGTEANESLSETQIIARLLEEGVTEEMIVTFWDGKYPPEVAEEAVVLSKKVISKKEMQASSVVKVEIPEQVLIFMDRENPTYEIRGYRFTSEHPFALVSADDAEVITAGDEGFRYATPKQARAYYS